MRKLLLLVMLSAITLTAAAQGYHWHRGDAFYYAIHSSQQMGSDHLTDNHYILRLRVTGKQDK